MVKLVPATGEHVRALYGKTLPVTIFGVAGVEDGRVLGMGAIYAEDGCMVVTCRIADEARVDLRRHARAILRAARVLLEEARKTRLPIRTVADRRYRGSVELLEHLGFRQLNKDVYEWTAST